MGWGEEHRPSNGGTGTTGQIELANEALDRLGVEPGPLALRVIALVGRMAIGHSADRTAGGYPTPTEEQRPRYTRGEKSWIAGWLFVGLTLMAAIYVPLVTQVVTRGW